MFFLLPNTVNQFLAVLEIISYLIFCATDSEEDLNVEAVMQKFQKLEENKAKWSFLRQPQPAVKKVAEADTKPATTGDVYKTLQNGQVRRRPDYKVLQGMSLRAFETP
jgi:hypothetical protein